MLMRTPRRDDNRSRTRLVLLVLAAVAVISLDAVLGTSSPAQPVRDAASSVLGPVESVAHKALTPVRAIGDLFTTRADLRRDNDALLEENARLRNQANTAGVDTARLEELEGIADLSTANGFETVQAQVVAIGGAQSFSRAVTIDVGTAQGVRRDMTVLNADGLVGRVVGVSRSNATVLLLVDARSTVGARLSGDSELGFVRGDGDLSGAGRLTLSTVDAAAVPIEGDSVVSWGSRGQVPYVAGVPIGRVESVASSPRDQSRTVTLAPYADFSALDVVGVVVARTKGR